MDWSITEPCQSCPYRRDARRAFWHPSVFLTLLANDRDALRGAVYVCHQTRKLPVHAFCAGWLLNQKKRDFPSIQLRLAISTGGERAKHCLDALNDGGHRLFASIEQMVAANLRRKPSRRRSR